MQLLVRSSQNWVLDFRLRGNDEHFARSALGLVPSFIP